MNAAAAFEVKGWCPGALRPMESGDGLLVRLKPWGGAFTVAQAAGIAELAAHLGNGQIDLTRRANLQIRGLSEEALPELHRALDRLRLLDADAATEAARNVMVGPVAGPDVRALTVALTQAIVADTFAPSLVDAQSYCRIFSSTGCVVTIPEDGTIDFPIDTELNFYQGDSGQVSFVGESTAVAINYPQDSNPTTAILGAVATIKKVATNEWDLFGRLELVSA